MSTGASKYRIDLLDSSNAIVGSGPLRNIVTINHTRTLDTIGFLSFSIPGNDAKVKYIGDPAVKFDIYHQDDGFIGRFYLTDTDIVDNMGQATMVVSCQDELQALQGIIAGFGRSYENDAIEDIVEDLLDTAGWTLDPVALGENGNLTLQGQNVYEAISQFLKRWHLHFRLGSVASELEIGTFGTLNTAVRLTNLRGQLGLPDATVGIIRDLARRVIFKSIYNRVIAVGAGVGASQLTMTDGEVGNTYTVDSRSPSYGQIETFIEDTASQTAYGIREIVVIFDQIRPIANTATAKAQAATELLRNAEEFLLRHKGPYTIYDNITVYGLQEDIRPGDMVNVRYIEKDDEAEPYIELDANLWVLEHRKQRTAMGDDVSVLKCATIDEQEMNDTDILAAAVGAIKSDRLWIKPTTFRQSDTYLDSIQQNDGITYDKDAKFTFTIDDTVTEVTRVILEWRTRPLYILANWSLPAITTNPSAPTNPHSHTISSQQLTAGFFVIEDDDLPTDVKCFLSSPTDGEIDITNHADVDYITGGNGIWNDGGTPNAALNVRMDISDLILADSGGIYQTFTVIFRLNAARSRNVAVPAVSNPTTVTATYGNHGFVEGRIIVEGVCQSKYRD